MHTRRRRKRRTLLPVLPLVFLAAVIVVICFAVFGAKPVNESVTVEAGVSEIPFSEFYEEGKEITLITDVSSIDLNIPGQHVLEFAYKKKTYTSTLVIADTVAPTGTGVDQKIYNDQTLEADDFVVDIVDVTAVTAAFAENPDFTKVGEQTVTVNLTDTSGNVGVVTAKLTVIADTTAPVFSPIEELTVNIGQSVSYRKNITATDDRDGEISYQIDSSDVNLEKEGTYIIKYTATDSSGNTTVAERKLHVTATLVVNRELVDEMAQKILDKIIKDGMTPHEKITEIYNYVRYNIAYTNSPETDIPNAAYKALTKRAGDCYNYFALAKVMLDCAGIDNLPAERYGGKTTHFWLLVNTGSGWYHYDCMPQSAADPYRCFMKTDAQVKAYANGRSDGRSDYYNIDYTKYPELATEKYQAK